jgi:hypothetical protein|tara:strand:- start:94 stop:609 length:516 start_codon:yes stop_codon:yes gene_type:complete
MAQIINITSEALQATIRRLLPSQQGFGEDLQASNVILPTIDVTPTAEGSILRSDLQTAIDNTMAEVETANTTNTVIAATGFIKVFVSSNNTDTSTRSFHFTISDGLSAPVILRRQTSPGSAQAFGPFTFYVPVGSTLQVVSPNVNINIRTNARQVADVTGNLTPPSGYTSE